MEKAISSPTAVEPRRWKASKVADQDNSDAMMSDDDTSFIPSKLMRCTSTPAAAFDQTADSETAVKDLAAPPEWPQLGTSSAFDSGIGVEEEMSSSSASIQSPAPSSTGTVPKRTTSRMRTRSSSASGGGGGGGGGGSFAAAKTRDIHRQIPDRNHLDGAESCDNEDGSRSCSGSRIVYSPGWFCGRDRLDIVRRLSDMGADHVLDHVWTGLNVQELSRSLQVSSLWNETIKMSKSAHSRWKEAKNEWTENSAGPGSRTRSRKCQLLKTSPRKALGNVSNVMADDHHPTWTRDDKASKKPLPPPILSSPGKFRHKLFANEASRLAPGEQLRTCPRCTSPSRLNPEENRAECTRISCQFKFCTKCMCEYHDAACRTGAKTSLTVSLKSRKNLNASLADASSSAAASAAAGGARRSRRLSATVLSEKSKSRLKRL